jgi:hypothetical protein
MLKVTCGSCGKSVKSSDAWAGRSAKCPNCNAAILFPAIDATPPEVESPVDRASPDFGAKRTEPVAKTPVAKSSAGNISSSGGAKSASSSPGRSCPVCGQSTPAEVANCIHCGEFLGVSTEIRSAITGSPALPAEYQDFEVPATAEANLIARISGILMLMIPICGLVYEYNRPHVANDNNSDVFFASVASLAVFGGPGLYITIRGALGGPRARKNRAQGMLQFLSGILVIGFGVGVSLLSMWIAVQIGIAAFISIGMIASGAILAAMGFSSLISGRNLKAEMSEINLFGGG